MYRTLSVGFILGLSHALEPDHLVAVGTLGAESSALRRASVLGACWGVGHTTTLLIVGGAILALKLVMPDSIARYLELLVGAMIVLLGTRVLVRAAVGLTAHSHEHIDGSAVRHRHFLGHTVSQPPEHSRIASHHPIRGAAIRAFTVGTIHGLAGSGALAVAVMSTMPSALFGLGYIGLFGIGSTGGMLLMSTAMGLPFVWVNSRPPRWRNGARALIGLIAVGFGVSYLGRFLFGW
jgi:ABC-type nickel/cobalt efflux system permease component RcnA